MCLIRGGKSELVEFRIVFRDTNSVTAKRAKVREDVAKALYGMAIALIKPCVKLFSLPRSLLMPLIIPLCIIGAFAVNAPAVVIIMLLGAVLVTGFGMIAGSYGRDFMGTLLVSMLFMIPLMIPAFGALFPGSSPTWGGRPRNCPQRC